MAARRKGPVFRVTGLPASQPDDDLAMSLKATIDDNLAEDEQSKLTFHAEIVPSCYDNKEKVALVEFHGGVPAFLSELKDNPLRDWQVQTGDEDINFDLNFDQHFFGFTQLYTPKADSPVTADIIAITGLDGHAYGSWRGKGNLGRMWLRDFVSKDLPHCRTMIYGYNSKLSGYGIDTIMDYSRGLMEELKKVRNTEELRKQPLFFIAHSFGGIILAHCLVQAVQTHEDGDQTIASLYKATYGMLLFGIPHKGLVVDDMQQMLAGQDKHPRGKLLEQIRINSDLLAQQLADFKNLIRDRKVVSFYETGQTRQLEFDDESKCWKRTGGFVMAVDTNSTLLQLPDSKEDKIPLDADHSMIVKFDAKGDRGYTSARDKLLQFERDAPDVVAARFLPSPGPDSKKEDKECIQHLRVTDPRDDKKRIEYTKGGLLKGSYCWILENSDFQQWRDDQQSRLLWVKGDPGKGKTMLLCGIVDELKGLMAQTDLLSYFFCQATDSRINNATAVLRGLLFLLVEQQPFLLSYIRVKHDHAGKTLFEDVNSWAALSEIFTNILQDPSLNSTYLVIDALDECVEADLPKLLDFIVKKSSVSPRVKWIVSSRNWPRIEKDLDTATHKLRLRLELNERSISAAVSTFIKVKVDWLAKRNRYSRNTQDAVQRYLSLNANGTFLWVALVCQGLSNISGWEAQQKLKEFPPGLDALYWRMIDQIKGSELCKRILAVVSAVYRPITLDELASFVNMPDGVANEHQVLSEIISLCGSFLTLQECTISFVHQSAKDFLVEKAYNDIYPPGIECIHYDIFSRSLQVMSKKLRRDIYGLGDPGFPINQVPDMDQVKKPDVDQVKQPTLDPLSPARYACVYWIDHLLNCDLTKNANNDLRDGGSINKFLCQSFLYWLEALSLCRSISDGVVLIAKLESLLQKRVDACRLLELVQDARRFIMYHKVALENSPLQAYASALLFSPARSLIRSYFKHKEPKIIIIQPAIGEQWSACLQTLEGHSNSVRSVAFSHDSTRLASASSDSTIWDANSGACLQTLAGHSDSVCSVAFSHDSTRLASGSGNRIVKIWDASSGACLQTLKGHSGPVRSVAFSHNSTWLASASSDSTVKIWDTNSGACLQTLEGHSNSVRSVAFSHDSTRLASASSDSTVKIWDANSGACLQTLAGHSNWVSSVAISHDSTRLASASGDKTAKIWDASSGACLQTLDVGKVLSNISFDTTGLYLHTDIGAISISATLLLSSTTTTIIESRKPKYQGLALSSDEAWIAHNSKKLVWLPSEYRPSCFAVLGKKIGIGVGSGKVWICETL
ncbi:uncharacterized protein BDZ99DRAFT_434927 [Mytilinidion resinicola]|uniref:Mitochondrial division protein 1 n=1 Tax=Mytilinidion resinicola TaxID=574789 RepID=A0A6A6Z2J8_9PEZI|nr:uncharacterized protein BDZ99DRAFT_434927 [Mytilinidion resinicola]KAF2814949.1 hypothetical protein BDZ99DRAFT_434927 [Mytilinidion resinicola]